jgi:predicted GNAT family acetyltransferase
MPAVVRNSPARSRYELDVDGRLALAHYTLAPGLITLWHTEVPPELEGRGIGTRLVREVLEDVRRQGLKVAATCSFVRSVMARHPEYNDLLA